MILSKIPKHVWYGVVAPVVLLTLAGWRLWPEIERYRAEEEIKAQVGLQNLIAINRFNSKQHARKLGEDVEVEVWTEDVSGLFRGTFERARFRTLAEADAAPVTPLVARPVPFHGYLFLVVKHDRSGAEMNGPHSIGYCAYPVTYGWRHKRTFIMSDREEGQIWRTYAIDNGGKPVSEWPTDKELAEKWKRIRYGSP